MRRRQSGVVLIELALVIPLILIALMGSIELTRVFEATQKVATTSRETTNVLHRNCYYATDPAPGIWGPGACMVNPMQSMIDINGATYSYMNGVLPGMQMLISIYRLDQTTVPWSVTLAGAISTPGYNIIAYPSRFQPVPDYMNFPVSALSATKQHVIVVEAFHSYTSLLPLVKRLNILPSLFNIYEATIF